MPSEPGIPAIRRLTQLCVSSLTLLALLAVIAHISSASVTTGPGQPATLTASPNPISVPPGVLLGSTTIQWSVTAVQSVEIHVGSPSGTLFAVGGASGSAPTGVWVSDGLTIYLQDTSGGKPLIAANTIAILVLHLQSQQGPALFTASPDPIQLPVRAALGITTLQWTAPAASKSVQIHVGAPNGILFAAGGSQGTATTGQWVYDGLTFYLQDVTGGKPLTAADTLATVVATTQQQQASLTAAPNPILLTSNQTPHQTSIQWSAPGISNVEVHIGSPSGPLFAAGGPSGSSETGLWVTSGMTFYLQDVSNGSPLTAANTLATQTVNLERATPSNSVAIAERSGVTQVARPFAISRVFAMGEIANFAQARVNGTPVLTQCDVRTRWPDGSLKHAEITFIADLPASATLTVDFVNQATGNNSGALDKAGMLALNWDGEIDITNGSTLSIHARQIVSDWAGNAGDARVTYWRSGPICTQVILEDASPTLAYDLGWDPYKSLHPIFIVTFFPGTQAGVKVEAILQNEWSTKLRDQSYSLTLRALGVPVYTQPTFTHYAKTDWRKTFWVGNSPGAVKIDHNLPYLIYTQVVPNFDLSKVVPASSVAADVQSFSQSDMGGIEGSALWTKFMPETGGRPDIGLFPAWYVRYLYTFDPNEFNVMFGNAAAAASVPIHIRESASSLFYDSAQETPAFGLPFSINAHPDQWIQNLPALAPLSTANGWTPDVAHLPNFAYIPYLITGDWYFLQQMYQMASYAVGESDPSTVTSYARHGNWGLLTNAIQTRGVAWATREVAQTAFMAPDGSPEQGYFTTILNNNIAVWEGVQNITNGAFYDPTPGSKWSWGRVGIANNSNNPLHFADQGDQYASMDNMDTNPANPDLVGVVGEPWEYNYLNIVFGHVNELGFPITLVQQTVAKNLLNQLVNPAYNPYLAGMYRMPVLEASTKTYYTDWGSVKLAYLPSLQNTQVWLDNGDADIFSGYPHIARAAASFLPPINDGPLSGQAAWDWINANVGYQNLVGLDPQWALLPR